MTDPLADEARRLRVEEKLSVRDIRARLGIGRDRVYALLHGVPPPDWTRRPRARDDLRAEAVRLRAHGRSVNQIAEQLGVAKSTAYQWVRHLPLDPDEAAAERRRAHSKVMTDARWGAYRELRDAAQAAEHERAAEVVGEVDERVLLMLGAAIYWCEGAKSKPWRRSEKVQFINSDPGLLAIFLRFLESCGVDRSAPTYRVSIHESADADAAVRWWVQRLRLPAERFGRTTLKRHNPTTVRRNTGDDYHGCLVITVPRSRALYWRIEGMIAELFRIADDKRA
ncbi:MULTISPECIES: helix-turn-helix domain-containing protein [Micromonospora]|uniref:Helix-turn-helix domain-containing protein n=1 Tax=Micromonospora solifontis TaxID=2487138 RepID=A0ABX9WG95_9ACTN|nr:MULTISPECIES: helix-turn-helix domain-containing protein [Micromonospora]NES14231.1 helix-turn-helix domain-containing protein [Micromonospora sp. PPF5-17B]NES37667.1 helix-turn-helix domain-containing protein [Micromonospora solifontis]NES55820.1 helix-turn-helix domain-containing protein [Micromonospora sp. PPF5-6]RNL98108.1 helix-turn-helix domain-containing protein [Micromonospora solifontis]